LSDESRLHKFRKGFLCHAQRSIYSGCACAQVPLSCDLGQAVAQLAFLGCYEGVVELPLKKAAAVDPDATARLPGEAGRPGREVWMRAQ
jgi:hypothetical protein